MAAVFQPPTWANSCKDRRSASQYLPPVINRTDLTRKLPYVLNCDTVEVSAGKTTEVFAGVMLYFARPQSGNVIRVSGTLKLQGDKDTWVFLSGSLDSSKGKIDPGKATWGGILVEPGGKLVMEYVGVWGAPTPVTAFSRQVEIRNSFFTGASGIVQPDGDVFELDATFAAVNNLDFAHPKISGIESAEGTPLVRNNSKPGGMSAAEKNNLLAKRASGHFWTPSKAWGFTTLVVLVGGGAGWYYLKTGESQNSTPGSTTLLIDPPPKFPPGL
jgi:hypothetical protein